MVVFVEKLNLRIFLILFFTNRIEKVYILDDFILDNLLIKFLYYLKKIKAEHLNYKILDFVDKTNELLRFRFDRHDLFKIQNKIESCSHFKKQSLLNNNLLLDKFIIRQSIGNGITDEKSITRALYFIEISLSIKKKYSYKSTWLILISRPWASVFTDYDNEMQISFYNEFFSIKKIKLYFFNKISSFILFHSILFNLKLFLRQQIKISKKDDIYNINKNNLYNVRRGDINFEKNGLNSDFFWMLNSKFERERIIYGDHTKKISIGDYQKIIINKVTFAQGPYKFIGDVKKLKFPKYENNKYNFVNYSIQEFQRLKREWFSIFNKYNVKILLNWERFSPDHLVMNDAIKQNCGLSVLWQIAFNGMPFWGSQCCSDIFLSFSKFSVNNELKNRSSSKYFIITGIPRDYSSKYLQSDAKNIMLNLRSKGAKKIVSVFDGNSMSDSRWHTGHELQKENYEKIILEILKNEELGVIFKPKHPQSLKTRLGNVYNLLKETCQTGRCIILDQNTNYQSPYPAILAGLASDICVHTDLSSGTAALECASAGKPVLIIDREGAPFSILNKLKKGKTRFSSWSQTIDAINEFNIKNSKNEIGDWSDLIDELDPFRDGLSATRIGNYLNYLLEGFDMKLKHDEIMENAAYKYAKKWGKDNVIT